jgi:ParB family chromosome partitioning protein
MKISDVKIGNRIRTDLGELSSLAISMRSVGLLHPIVIDSSMNLIAGARRIAAAVRLGWKEIPHRQVDSLSDAALALLAERDENLERLSLKPSEIAALAKRLEPLEKAAAKERQRKSGGDHKNSGCAKLAQPKNGRTREKIAAAVGVGHGTLDKIEAVVAAAEENPEEFGPVLEEMDNTGKVDPAYRKIKESKSPSDEISKYISSVCALTQSRRSSNYKALIESITKERRRELSREIVKLRDLLNQWLIELEG